jgi:predicted RecA/RadA family phage recombinase
MATNIIFEPGYKQALVVTNPASPASGDPIRIGTLTGIAEVDEGDGGNVSTETSVNIGPFVAEFYVDDNVGGGIAVGDSIYYHDTATGTPSTHLNNDPSGADAFFGVAQEVVTANATTNIRVFHVPLNPGSGVVNAGSIVESDLGGALAGSADGLSMLRVAKATFDPSAVSGHRTIAAHTLGVTIPDNAIICGGFVEVLTTFTSATDAGTIAIHVQSANDIVSALAISNGSNIWDAGLHPIIPKANTPESNGIKLTAGRLITATVAVEALTAGKATIFIFYVQGD